MSTLTTATIAIMRILAHPILVILRTILIKMIKMITVQASLISPKQPRAAQAQLISLKKRTRPISTTTKISPPSKIQSITAMEQMPINNSNPTMLAKDRASTTNRNTNLTNPNRLIPLDKLKTNKAIKLNSKIATITGGQQT